MRLAESDRHQLQLDAELLGDVGGQIRLDADEAARRVAEAERLVVGLDADDERAALLDVVEHVGIRRRAERHQSQQASG